jgi:chaperonin cofactor prefoldin
MNQSALRLYVRSLIVEAKDKKATKKSKHSASVEGRLKMIDEAGDKAALQAKINKIDEDIKEANEIKNAVPTNIGHFVAPEIISDLHDDLAKAIEELEAKKAELEEQMKGMEGAKEEPKKTTKAGAKSDLKEELDTNKVYGGTGQNQGDSGSSLQFKVTKNTPESFEIDYVIVPNSKYRQSGAGSKSPREKQYGTATILKSDIQNGSIRVKGDSYYIGKDFVNNL